MTDDYVSRVRDLNDAFRKTFEGGRVLITRGVEASGYVNELLEFVKKYDRFTEDVDPYKENDFDAFDFRGERFYWKVDYYDLDLRFHSEDKSNPAVTQRVLTIMKAEEY